MKNLFLLIVCLVVCIATYAQDIIVLADGSSIQAKVDKVSSSEIEYKKASNPMGPTYTLNIKDVLLIEYQNGTRDVFNKANAVTAPTVYANTAYRAQETASGFSSDDELRAMYYGRGFDNDYNALKKKAKIWKIVGWSVGPSLVVAGGIFMGIGLSWNLEDDGLAPFIFGSVLTAAGVGTTAFCLYQSHKLNKQAKYYAFSAPLYNYDLHLNNGKILSFGVDAMRIGSDRKDMGIGLGIRYKF